MATLAVIPCLNEEPRIAPVVRELRALHPQIPVLVIDDGSSDKSARQAQAAGAKVLKHKTNRGYGSALLSGYRYALKRDFQNVVQLDGDGQHLPSEINALLQAIDSGNVDLALGSRFLGPSAGYPVPLHRRSASRLLGTVLGQITDQRFTDPTSGFQAISRPALEELSRLPFPSDFPDADVLLRLHRLGLRIQEVPVVMRPRSGGRSMHSGISPLRYAASMPLRLSQAWWATREETRKRKLASRPEPAL